VLERVLASSSYALRVQAVSAMAALGHYPNEQRARLEELIASADPRAIKAVAKLLETPAFQALDAGEAFEPILIGLLGHDPTIAAVAIDALAKIGTVRAVEPLLACTRRILVDGTLRRAAREAVEQIQLRLDDVDRGRLSLAHDSDVEGALSLEDVAGAVSLPSKRS
jgi:HEAT repeat protein